MRDAGRDAPLEVSQVQDLWRPDEACAISVDDGGDEVECFHDGAFAGVVLPDDDRAGVERDGVVAKAPIVLQTEGV